MPRLPAGAFVPQLRQACTAIGNRLDREWPADRPGPHGEQTVLRALVLASGNAFDAILYLCSEIPPDASRKIEFALALPPLSRVILEAVFTVNFLLEDLPDRAKWFLRAGWRSMAEEHTLSVETFGAEPSWQEWLEAHQHAVDSMADQLNIPPDDRADLEAVARHWPTPSKMMSRYPLAPARLARMRYLDMWFYGQLSSAAHLKWSGLARSVAPLLRRERDENMVAGLVKTRSDVVVTSAVMLLALLSEIEIELRFGHAEELRYAWTVLGDLVAFAKSLYDSQYRARF